MNWHVHKPLCGKFQDKFQHAHNQFVWEDGLTNIRKFYLKTDWSLFKVDKYKIFKKIDQHSQIKLHYE